ncbi:MAG: hypothetical protein Tsb0015_15070 [Simkaniaceae bacterium]
MKRLFAAILLVMSFSAFSYETSCLASYTPWFTGPLLNFTATNLARGEFYFQPTLLVFHTYGNYDENWNLQNGPDTLSINPSLDFQMGITDRFGLEVTASLISNWKQGRQSTRLEDTIFILGYQILEDISGSWRPNFRIDLIEIIPTGSYNKLNPQNLGTDSTGEGSFQTGFVLIVKKTFPVKSHYLSLEGSFSYFFPASVHVQGFNAYGGGFNTRGTVHPGDSWALNLSAEYSLSQRWGIILETIFEYQAKSTFSGKPGFLKPGIPAEVGLPSSFSWSLAPEIEYNFTSKFGMLFGMWLTLLGRNTDAFYSGFLSFVYTF